jgi:hypothetical protein
MTRADKTLEEGAADEKMYPEGTERRNISSGRKELASF